MRLTRWFVRSFVRSCGSYRATQVKSSYDAAKREMDAATEGSREAAEAQVAVETTKAMAAAIGIVLAS